MPPRIPAALVPARASSRRGSDNLEVPRHMYLSDTQLLIGEDSKG